ncbi:MAG: tyrosine-type recombinase/integrase [Candidatus Deferrimicrobiaceae bacterium]
MEGYVKASLKPSAQSTYADILKNHLVPAFGKRFINEITRKDIKDFICAKKAKVRSVKFHELRHSFCSWMIQNGENLVYVKDLAGHSSIKVTVDIYGHLIPGKDRPSDAQEMKGNF